MNLAELQQQFVKENAGKQSTIFDFIQLPHLSSKEERFSIYKNSIHATKINALEKIYNVCHKLVGKNFFIVMASQYILQNSSYSTDLGEYGENFSTFIADFSPARSLLYLPDVARLEWAWHQNFKAPLLPPLDLQKLNDACLQQGEMMIFSISPFTTLLSSIYPVHLIWQLNQKNDKKNQKIFLPVNEIFYYIIYYRKAVRIELITLSEWKILNWIKNSLTLIEICEKCSAHSPTLNISQFLVSAIQRGWLIDICTQKK